MIEGVRTKELKLIPDERGFLMEMLRCDDDLYEGFGQVYMTGCTRGVAKAWHYHREQTDHFVCVFGKALVVLYDMREGSPTFGAVQEFLLDAPPLCGAGTGGHDRQLLLKIPSMVAHGFAAFECDEARIMNVPTLPYRYDDPDEFRFPWNSEKIPYSWPSYITRGG
ncbi:MAG: dTDP-4-dehydrorhamnose 3,5-epimerase family protein [Thermodesulfobacteriota bacterium]